VGFVFSKLSAPAAGFAFSKFVRACGGLCFLFGTRGGLGFLFQIFPRLRRALVCLSLVNRI